MPVDRTHAFGEGPTFGRPGLVARLRRPHVASVWRSFDRGAIVGAGCRLGPHAWCANDGPRAMILLGDDVVCRGIVRREAFGDGRVVIGDDVYIGDDCIVSAAASIEIGSGTLLGHGVHVFDNNSQPVEAASRAADWRAVRDGAPRAAIDAAPVRIGEQAWVGFGSVVLKGVTIGARAVVAAASVVTHDVPDGAIVAGNPARALPGSRQRGTG
jgi:acetyltransferase-like isoleucine patch superfamily enzyme